MNRFETIVFEMWPLLERILAIFGLLLALSLFFRFCSFVYFYYIQGSGIRAYHHGKEPWAVVTGSSAGIGFGLAREITKYGFNVVLIGHKPDELGQAAAQIEQFSPKAKTKIIVLDAAKASFADIEKALETAKIRQLNVTVLINNVGGRGDVFTKHYKAFPDYTPAEIDSVLAINNRFMVYMTSLMIPVLSSSNGRTLLVNIGSMADGGVPYQTLYSGTKSFIKGFSNALAWELEAEGYNINVVDVVPGEVRTQGHNVELGWAIVSAEVFAESALKRVGPGRGRYILPYSRHRVLQWITHHLPEDMLKTAATKNMWKMRDTFDGKPVKKD